VNGGGVPPKLVRRLGREQGRGDGGAGADDGLARVDTAPPRRTPSASRRWPSEPEARRRGAADATPEQDWAGFPSCEAVITEPEFWCSNASPVLPPSLPAPADAPAASTSAPAPAPP
jgi:hypothetical protein